MASKNSKLAGKYAYYQNAQKLIKWPLNIEERLIYVPENELEEARYNLTVMHLTNSEHRFHIQSDIPDGVKFGKDEIQAEWHNRIRERQEAGNIGKTYEVVSDGSILVCMKQDNQTIMFAYRNRNKADLTLKLEDFKKKIEWKLWKERSE